MFGVFWAQILGVSRGCVAGRCVLRPGNTCTNFTHLWVAPWAWERESRRQKPKSPHKSLEKVSKKSRKPGPKSLKKSLEKGPKSQKKVRKWFFLNFSGLFETFFGLLGPGPGRLFRDLFGDFLAFGPETPSFPGPRNPNACTGGSCWCGTICPFGIFSPTLRVIFPSLLAHLPTGTLRAGIFYISNSQRFFDVFVFVLNLNSLATNFLHVCVFVSQDNFLRKALMVL